MKLRVNRIGKKKKQNENEGLANMINNDRELKLQLFKYDNE
jgi:hypothetical protein